MAIAFARPIVPSLRALLEARRRSQPAPPSPATVIARPKPLPFILPAHRQDVLTTALSPEAVEAAAPPPKQPEPVVTAPPPATAPRECADCQPKAATPAPAPSAQVITGAELQLREGEDGAPSDAKRLVPIVIFGGVLLALLAFASLVRPRVGG